MVVTTSILGDVVSNIVEDDAEVEVLIPPGASPHDYKPSSRQVAALSRADLVVANGLGLEEGLHDALEAAAADGARVFEVAGLVDPIPFGALSGHVEGEDDHAAEDDHAGGDDPHFWMDPTRVGEASSAIADELGRVDDSVDWRGRAEAYADELGQLDKEIAEMLAGIPAGARKLVSNHHSLGYFADQYDFELIGVIIPGGSTLGDPSSEELAALVAVIEEHEAKAVFAETIGPSALAEAVAEETGHDVEVVGLHTGSLGAPGSGAETYVGMMRANAALIADALR